MSNSSTTGERGVESQALAACTDAIESARKEIETIKTHINNVLWVRFNVAPVLPEGVELSSSHWSYIGGYLEVTIPTVEGRAWREVAALIYRTRKALGIAKLTRTTSAFGGAVYNTYYGSTTDFAGKDISLTIRTGDQLPTTCKVVFEEKEVTEVKRVAKVVCK